MAMTWEYCFLVFLLAESIISAVSVVANGLVLLALFRFPSLRTTTNTLIGSLALSDLLVNCVVGPTSAMTFHGPLRDLYGCIFINCLAIVFTNMSVLNLLLITIERFLAIKYPIMHRRKVTKRKVWIAIGMVWSTGMFIGFVPLMGWYRRREFSDCSFTAVIPPSFIVYVIFLGVVFPCIVFMIFVYINIFLVFVRQDQFDNMCEITFSHQSEKKHLRHCVMSAALIVLLFGLTWFPLYVLHCLQYFQSVKPPLELRYALVFLSHTGSAINPFLYAISATSFRRAIKRMLARTLESAAVQRLAGVITLARIGSRFSRRDHESRTETTLTTSEVPALDMEDKNRTEGTSATNGETALGTEDKNITGGMSATNALGMEDKNRTIRVLTTRGGSALDKEDKIKTTNPVTISEGSADDNKGKNRIEGTSTTNRENASDMEDEHRNIESFTAIGGSAFHKEDKTKTRNPVVISEGSADDNEGKTELEGTSERESAFDTEDKNKTGGALTTRTESAVNKKDKSGTLVSDSDSVSLVCTVSLVELVF